MRLDRADGDLEDLGKFTALELRGALDWRHLTMAIATAGLFVTFGLVGGGLVRFSFMPKVDADNVVAYLQMPQGTPEELTAEVATRIEAAALELGRELDAERPGEAPLIRHVNTSVGVQPTAGGVPKSPIRLTTNALRPASAFIHSAFLLTRSNQNPMSR